MQVIKFKIILFFLLFYFSLLKTYSQIDSCFAKEFSFASHLSKQKDYKNAIYILKNISCKIFNGDSVNYFLGYNFFKLNQFDSAFFYFSNIDSISCLSAKSKFYQVYALNYLSKYNKSDSVICKINEKYNNEITDLKTLQTIGSKLLNKEFIIFKDLQKDKTNGNFIFNAELYNLNLAANKYQKIKEKSMFKAGLLSAFVPGLGKYYLGNKGQFLGAFIPILILGNLATESYVVSGIKSVHFILYSSLFTIFYVGNIWGSTLSVKVKKNEANEEFRQTVLINLDIPLDRIFK